MRRKIILLTLSLAAAATLTGCAKTTGSAQPSAPAVAPTDTPAPTVKPTASPVPSAAASPTPTPTDQAKARSWMDHAIEDAHDVIRGAVDGATDVKPGFLDGMEDRWDWNTAAVQPAGPDETEQWSYNYITGSPYFRNYVPPV